MCLAIMAWIADCWKNVLMKNSLNGLGGEFKRFLQRSHIV